MRAIEKIRMHYELQEEKGQRPNKKILRALKNDIKLKELEKQLNLAGSQVNFSATDRQANQLGILKLQNQDHLESYRNLRDMPSIVRERDKEMRWREKERNKRIAVANGAKIAEKDAERTTTQLGG